jgi:MFS family permease
MNKNQNLLRKPKAIFYGWIVVACSGVILFVAFGSAYSFTTFFESLQDEFHTTRGSTSVVFAIAGFLYFSLGALSGRIADRIGSKRVITFGVLVIAAGLLLASRAATLGQIYAIYGIGIGIGVGFTYVPAVGVVQRWFVRRRGLASGLAVTGIGLGTLAMPVFSALLIHWSGWRTAYLLMGLLVLACGIGAAFLIVETPETLDLQPDGDPIKEDPITPEQQKHSVNVLINGQDITLKETLQVKPFWLLYAGTFSSSVGLFIPFVHMLPYSNDFGLSTSTGVMLFSLIGVGSTVGRFLVGGMADKFGRRRSLVGMYAGVAAMLAWWLVATRVWQLVVFTFIFGTCYGGFVALLPAVTADYFNGPNISGIIGALYTGVGLGALIGPSLAGFMFDIQKSYSIPIIVGTIAALLAAVSAALLEDPGKWRESFLDKKY